MTHPATIFFSPAHPLFANFKFEFLETKPDFLAIKFVALKEFIDRVETNHLHSGFCTLMLDSVMGGSVMGSLEKLQPIATINLTTQHSHRAMLNDTLICSANVESIEDQVAVVTGRVMHGENNEILANAVGSFMIGTRAIPLVATPLSAKSGAN